MRNFGVREVVQPKSTPAPGWAYVSDLGSSRPRSTAAPGSRARRRTAADTGVGVPRDAQLLRELATLERDNQRTVTIPIASRRPEAGVRGTSNRPARTTPAVRKILQSHKTFANYLADYEALSPSSNTVINWLDLMPDPQSISDHGAQINSGLPALPPSNVLELLCQQPALSYIAARGPLVPADKRHPPRRFCAQCGYWGRITCSRCGVRICALECYTQHLTATCLPH
ncbi:BgTH12-06030 [Blumeria graminis f. sp. triticale]|nr:BgTH12-06030 [Blumeria graminis f. sp. triticale]